MRTASLRDAPVAVGVGGEVLQTHRRLAAVLDLRVGKADFAGLVVETETGELVSLELLEAAVGQPDRVVRNEPCLAAFNDEWGVLDRQALGKIAVVCQEAAAVADGEQGRD